MSNHVTTELGVVRTRAYLQDMYEYTRKEKVTIKVLCLYRQWLTNRYVNTTDKVREK